MKVSFEGVGEQVLSFEKASGTEKGVFVKVSANNTVAACAAADNFAGYCIDTADGFAVVKTHGYIDATVIIGLKQNPTNGRRFSPIFLLYRAFCGAKHRMPL